MKSKDVVVPEKEKVQKKLDSLTPEQELLISVFKQKWVDLFYNNTGIDKEKAIEKIGWLYTFCERPIPEILFADSPLACKKIILEMMSPQKEENLTEYLSSSFYVNVSDYGWVAFYDFFQSLDFLDFDWTNFNIFKDLLRCGMFELYTFEKVCIVCSIPKVKQDAENKLHCEDGYAVIFANGDSMCYWHGVNVIDRWIFDKSSITKKEIIEEKNVEKRRAIKEILGTRAFTEVLGVVCIDEDVDASGNPVKLLKSIELDETINDYLYFANVICPSTKREYFISIPGTTANGSVMDNCWSAVAWTFKMNKEEYKPTLET